MHRILGRSLTLAVLLCTGASPGGAQTAELPALLEAYRATPSDARLCLRIGIAYTELRDLTHAAGFYRKALSIDPELLAAHKNLATVLWFLNRKQESIQEFTQFLKRRPDDPVPHLYLGLAAYEAKRFSVAGAHFQKAGALALENPEVFAPVLETLTVTQNVAGLEKMAAAHPDRPEVYLTLGDALETARQPDRSFAAYKRALELNPASEEPYLAVARFASAHKNTPYALQAVEDGLRRVPGSARLLVEQGLLRAMEGDRVRSEESLRKAAAADPRWAVPVLALGVSLLEHGEAAEAAARFHEAAKLDPRDFRAEYLYATALGRTTEHQDDPKIIEALRRAVTLNPADANSHASLGKAFLDAGRLEPAAAELNHALKLDPNNLTALYQLGLAYQRQGRQDAARTLLERFRTLKANSREESAAVVIMRIVRGK